MNVSTLARRSGTIPPKSTHHSIHSPAARPAVTRCRQNSTKFLNPGKGHVVIDVKNRGGFLTLSNLDIAGCFAYKASLKNLGLGGF